MKASLRFAVCLLLVLSGASDAPAQESVVRSDTLRELRAQDTLSSGMVQRMRDSTLPLEEVTRVRDSELREAIDRAASEREPVTRVPAAPEVQPAPAPASAEPPAAASAATTPMLDLAALRQQAGVGTVELYQTGRKLDIEGTSAIPLEQGQIVAVRDPSAQPVTVKDSNGTQSASPTRLIALDALGKLRQLALVHRVQGLTWSRDMGRFTGVLLVGLIDRERPGEQARLPEAIAVQLLAAGALLNPQELAIDRIGGRLERIDVSIADPDDPFTVQLVSPVDQDVPQAVVPLHRIPLVIMAPAQIDAFGIGVSDITVRGRSGRLHPGDVVTLDLDNGALDATSLTVGPTGVATTRLRSTGLGQGELKVVGGPYVAAPVKVRYATPLLFLMATIIGAMLGATIFVYARNRGGKLRPRLLFDWLIGIIVGVGITAMIYAGMKLPAWLPTPHNLVGTLAPFAMAFVAAAMGAALITFLAGFKART